jgi:hypothetical protein
MSRLAASSLLLLLAAPPAVAQSVYTASLSAGSGFTVDIDDSDPPGAFSFTAAIERRKLGKAFSFGLEAGRHHFLAMRQNLPPDVSGWASILEEERTAWRFTPFVRWQTRGDIARLYGQLGAGLYLQQSSYFQQERVSGELVVDTRHASSDPHAGFNLGVGLELFPVGRSVGIGGSLRAHNMVGGGDGFFTAELGMVLRFSARPAASVAPARWPPR